MELTDNDRQRIRNQAQKVEGHNDFAAARTAAFRAGAEYATIYEREKEGERCPSLPECYAASKKLEALEAERSELVGKLQNRFDNVADLIGLVQQTNDTITMVRLQSEFSFLDDLLNSLKK